MCELTLDAFGYNPDEARVARRLHVLLHEQDAAPPLPAWLQRQPGWSGTVVNDDRTRVVLTPHGGPFMLQEQKRHPAGTFLACRQCNAEPRHIQGRGSHSREAFDVLRPTGTRHQLECKCGSRTGWHDELADAMAEWQRHYGKPVESGRSATVRPLLRLHKDTA